MKEPETAAIHGEPVHDGTLYAKGTSQEVSQDVSRRDFLKLGGIAAAGGAAAISAGSLTACVDTTNAAKTELDMLYTCPIDGKNFASYDALRGHFETNHLKAVVPEVMTLSINGVERKLQVEPQWTLQETLQHTLGLTGAKTMCDRGGCGSCTVLIDDIPTLSCMTLAIECEGRRIETVEGIAADQEYQPLFDAFVKNDGSQCGYCSPGQVVLAKYVIKKYGTPTEDQINNEMASNICRCGSYPRHAPAILEAVQSMRGGD
jgi:xanthine dehydrogenase YagT iron-sulfur-binding subunit